MIEKFVTHFGEVAKSREKSRVVMTAGVFDVPHVGHPRYLTAARQHGEILIVGVHSDELVRRRKGADRPIFPLMERIELLSYYQCVDLIVELRDQDKVYEAIRTIKPHVLVVSTTTEDPENCPATMLSMFGSTIEVVVLGPQSERHTTDLINKKGGIR